MADTTPTPVTAKDTGPLDWRVPITDGNGRPTSEFQRRWNTQRNNNDKIGTTIGHGLPTGDPTSDGLSYIDEGTNPATSYVSFGGAWHQVAAIKFTDLLDAPHSYTSHAGQPLRVNAGATGVEFTTESNLLDGIGSTQGDILYRSATGWTVLAPSTSGFLLKTNGAGANPSWVTPPTGTGTVSSVALTAPSFLSVAGSPITTSGTLALSLATQNANLIFAGPASGAAAAPSFRGIVAADLPLATAGAFGAVKPDGTTVTVTAGVLSAVGGGTTGVTSYFGVGAPSTTHNTGDLYFDTTTTPYVGYVQNNVTTGGAIPATDGVVNAIASTTNAVSATLTTTHANDIIVVVVNWEVVTGTMPTCTGVAASGLTFTRRSTVTKANGAANATMEVWWAPATTVQTAKVITASFSSNFDDLVMFAFGVSGATSLSTPWDANVSLPATGSAISGLVTLGYSTTSSSDFVIWAEGGNGSSVAGAPTGFTSITARSNGGGSGFADLSSAGIGKASPVTGGSVVSTGSPTGIRNAMVDAISGAGSSVATWVPIAPNYPVSSWTPTVNFGSGSTGITYAIRTGQYTQIGKQVTLTGAIALSSKGTSTGAATISGFPISGSSFGTVALYLANMTTVSGQFQANFGPGDTNFGLFVIDPVSGNRAVTNADFSGTVVLIFTIVYFVP